MKLTESAAFKLFDKYGISHPKIGVKTGKVVVKADLAMGGKKKVGLVKVCEASAAEKVAREMGTPVIVEEYIPHEAEFFVALRATREGVETYTSDKGGIDVEQNWGKVKKTLDKLPKFAKYYKFFEEEDVTYLEINPYTEKFVALGVVLELDEAARFRHPDWPDADYGLPTTAREQKIREIDREIKGSVKLVEVPGGGDTALMAGGAGAALFLCDAVMAAGLKLANYAEFSGNPPNWALTELTKQVCAIPGLKNLVIGSGIANFTNVKNNIEAIVAALRASPQSKALNIVVRRCGPGEEEGMAIMKAFATESGYKIKVFGRETPMTEIVRKLNQ